MKLKQGLILHDTLEGTVAVATGDAANILNGMLRLSETAAFMMHAMEEETTEDAIVASVMAEYSVEEARARADVRALIQKLDEVGLIEYGNQ